MGEDFYDMPAGDAYSCLVDLAERAEIQIQTLEAMHAQQSQLMHDHDRQMQIMQAQQTEFQEQIQLQFQQRVDALLARSAEASDFEEPCIGDGELPVDMPDISVEQPVEQESEQQATEPSLWDFAPYDGEPFHQAWGRFRSLASEYSEDDDYLRDNLTWSFYVRLPQRMHGFVQMMSGCRFLSHRPEVAVQFLDDMAEQERAGLFDDPLVTHFGASPGPPADDGSIPQVHGQTFNDDSQPCPDEDADFKVGTMLSRVGDDSSSRTTEICEGDIGTDHVEEPEPDSSSELSVWHMVFVPFSPPQAAHDATLPMDDYVEREIVGEYSCYTWSDDDEDDTRDGGYEASHLQDPEPLLPLSLMHPPPPEAVTSIAGDDSSSDDAEDMCDGLSLLDLFMEPETCPPPLSFQQIEQESIGDIAQSLYEDVPVWDASDDERSSNDFEEFASHPPADSDLQLISPPPEAMLQTEPSAHIQGSFYQNIPSSPVSYSFVNHLDSGVGHLASIDPFSFSFSFSFFV